MAKATHEELVSKFLNNSYSGQLLLKEHSLNEEGTWRVFGEDENCDFGGSHHQPELGLFTGKLVDVVDYAVDLPRFWTWGSGGDIRKLADAKPITPRVTAEYRKDIDRIAQLTAELAALKEKHGID